MLGCLGKGGSCWVRMVARFEQDQLLFADDTVLVADSEENLCRLVSELGRVCERIKFRGNVGKSKVMRCYRARSLVMGANACDTKRRTVRGSGLFHVPWVASGN